MIETSEEFAPIKQYTLKGHDSHQAAQANLTGPPHDFIQCPEEIRRVVYSIKFLLLSVDFLYVTLSPAGVPECLHGTAGEAVYLLGHLPHGEADRGVRQE